MRFPYDRTGGFAGPEYSIFVDKVTPDTYTDNVILQKLVYEENAFELLLMDKYKNKVKQNPM